MSDLSSTESIDSTEAKLQKVTAALERRNRLFQDFAYSVSHDLQAPLRHLTQFSSILVADHGDDINEDALRTIDHIVSSTQRLQTMLSALLDYSRIESQGNEFAPVDLNEVIANVREDHADRLATCNGKLTADPLPVIVGDQAQLQRLFWHLVDNAIKYCEAEPIVHVSAERESMNWQIAVADNGIGIDSRHNESVFTLFRRLQQRPDVDGRGEGLALCQRIAERHDGALWCQSEGNTGSTFVLQLPATDEPAIA